MSLFYKLFPTHAARYTLYGVLFGLGFPLVATLFEIFIEGGTLSLSGMLEVQSDPPMWIIDTAPFVLGVIAFIAGKRHDQLEKISAHLEQLVAERTVKLNQEVAVGITRE